MKKNPNEIYLSINQAAMLLGRPRRTVSYHVAKGLYITRLRPGCAVDREIQLSSLPDFAISKHLHRPLSISTVGVKLLEKYSRIGFVPQDKIKAEIKDNFLIITIDLSND